MSRYATGGPAAANRAAPRTNRFRRCHGTDSVAARPAPSVRSPAMIRIVLPFLLALASPRAQTPAPPTGELEALAAKVETAHRPKGPVPRITALRATFTVHLLDPTAEQRGQVDLAVQFLEWQRTTNSKTTALVRYQMSEASTQVVRGLDRDGPWQIVKGEARDLESADSTQDLEAFRQHANVLKQLVRFLSPGDALRSLQEPGPVRTEDLVIGREDKVACQTIEGRLAEFPMVRKGQADGPVAVKFWIAEPQGVVVAVDVWPLRDGKPDTRAGERILLQELKDRDGVLVPLRLKHLQSDAEGKLRTSTEAVLVKLELRPELRVEDFDRTRK